MLADETQVGGEHYKSGYQHWTWVHDVGLGYLEGQVTKYVCRWRRKNGTQDLQKAEHFLTKLTEVFLSGQFRKSLVPPDILNFQNRQFANNNDLTEAEAHICFLVTSWTTVKDLDYIGVKIADLRRSAQSGLNKVIP